MAITINWAIIINLETLSVYNEACNKTSLVALEWKNSVANGMNPKIVRFGLVEREILLLKETFRENKILFTTNIFHQQVRMTNLLKDLFVCCFIQNKQ